MADKLLEIKDLEVLYKSGKNPVHAVNGISLTLNKGETLGLVGETGAGKTTIVNLIMRFYDVTPVSYTHLTLPTT